MHIIITAIGSAGDINPLILIASKLKQEGHSVNFIASPFFAEKAERQGLGFLPLGTHEDYAEAISEPDAWKADKAFPIVWKYVTRASQTNFDLICNNMKDKNTLLIGTSMAIGARFAQEKLGLPMATVHLSPSLMMSAYDTPESFTFPIPEWAPHFVKAMAMKYFDRFFLDPICLPSLNEMRQKLQLPPVKNSVISKWLHSPDLVVCAFPSWFAAVQSDWPPNSFNTNFPLYRSQYDPPLLPELEKFLEAGEPPIAFTAGTAMAFAGPLMQLGLEVAEKAKKRCLLVCDFKDEIPRNLPDWAMHIKYANFQSLFKRISLAVHHGGIGTSAMALASGCPQLITPFAHDQFDNSKRLLKMGVARPILLKDKLDVWVEAVTALNSDKVKQACIAVKQRMEAEIAGEDAMLNLLNEKIISRINRG